MASFRHQSDVDWSWVRERLQLAEGTNDAQIALLLQITKHIYLMKCTYVNQSDCDKTNDTYMTVANLTCVRAKSVFLVVWRYYPCLHVKCLIVKLHACMHVKANISTPNKDFASCSNWLLARFLDANSQADQIS